MIATIPIESVKKIVNLLAEVAQPNIDLAHKKQLLMQGLIELVDADYWGWGIGSGLTEGSIPNFSFHVKGGFDDEQFKKFLVAIDHPDMAELSQPFIDEFRDTHTHFTRHSHQFDPEQKLKNSEAGILWHEANISDTIVSWYPLSYDCVSAIGIYRMMNKPAFTELESTISHLILSEVPWLHKYGWKTKEVVKIPELPHRSKTVLNLLLEGATRKEIASHMSLSEHTVNDYVKKLFKFFNVSSQPQLMVKFRHG